MVEVSTLNSVFNNRQYVPMSEMLYRIFKPNFEIWIPDEKEYDELFDKLELLTSLKYIELEDKNGILPGRYVHTRRNPNNIIHKKFEDLEHQKENLDWIKEGLFNNYDSLKNLYTYFNENVKNQGVN